MSSGPSVALLRRGPRPRSPKIRRSQCDRDGQWAHQGGFDHLVEQHAEYGCGDKATMMASRRCRPAGSRPMSPLSICLTRFQ